MRHVNKLSYKTLLTVVVLLTISIVFLLKIRTQPISVSAGWFDDQWSYRQAINISSHTAAETNVYIIATVNIGTTTKAQADDGDFRFTDSTGSLLSYYISSGVGTTAITFHIQFSSLPAGASTLYAYYGNPTVTNGFSSTDFTTQATSYALGSYGSEELGGGPIAYWKFDEGVGTTAYDSTVNVNNGLMTGTSAPTWQTEDMCVNGKCLEFDGTNDFINAGNNSSLDLTNALTVETWVKFNSLDYTNNTGKLIGFAAKGNPDSPSSNYGWWFSYDNRNNGKAFGYTCFGNSAGGYGGGGNQLSGSNYNYTFTPGIWYHLAITVASSQAKLYVNGIQLGPTKSLSNLQLSDTTNNLRLGSLNGSYFLNGFEDDVKIYPYARTAAQIKSDYASRGSVKGSSVNLGSSNQNLSSFNNGLVAYWKFDEGAGTSSVDSSGVGNTVTFAAGTSAPGWSAGKFGIGTSLDGVNDYASAPNAGLNTTAGGYNTVSFWTYWTGTTSQILYNIGSPYYDIWIQSATCMGFNTGAGEAYGFNPTGLANQWFHLTAIMYNGAYTGKNKIYINGVEQTLTQCAGSAQSGTAAGSTVYLGLLTPSTGYFYKGLIDEFRIYNRALQPAEVSQLYNYAPGPIGYWNFDEGSGTTAKDTSGNNNTATLQNSAGWNVGKYGDALSLNIGSSANQYATITQVNHNYGFTKEAWIYPIDTTQCGETRCSVIGPYFEILSNLQYYDTNLTPNGWHRYGTIPLNQWTHIAVAYDNTTLGFFVNGIQVGSTLATNTGVHFSNTIGAYGSNTRNFRGRIDEVKIYNYSRTPSQIVSDMNVGHPAGSNNSMLAHYAFDEGYGTTVNNTGSVGSTLNATLTGTTLPTWTKNGQFGTAVNFSGNAQYVNVPDNNLLDMGYNDITLSAWIKTSTTGATQNIIRKDNGAGFSGYIFRLEADNRPRISFAGASRTKTIYGVANSANDGNWHQLTTTLNRGQQTITFYLDGKQVSTSTDTTNTPLASENIDNTNAFFLSSTSSEPLLGSIDDVKIYNYALTPDDIKLDYNRGSALVLGSSSSGTGNTAPSSASSQDYCVPGDTASCSPPVAEWKMDENTGSVISDTSGTGNTGAFGSGSSAPTWTTGYKSPGLKFNGTTSNITVADSSNLLTNQYTMELWARKDGNGNQSARGIMISKDANYIDTCYSGKVLFSLAAPGQNLIVGSTCPAIGVWTHYAATYDGAVGILYINGVQATSVAITGSVNDSTNPLYIGQFNGGSYNFNGAIDQVRIFSYARSPAQIAWDYNRGQPLYHFKLDECQGGIVYNSAGVGNTGTITIGAGGSQVALGTCSVGTTTAWGVGASGKYGASLNFDGTDDYVNAGDITTFDGLTQMTISAWIYPNSLPISTDINSIVAKADYQSYPTNGYFIRLRGTEGVRAQFSDGTNYVNCDTTTLPSVSTWTQVTAVLDSNHNCYVYFNGQQKVTSSVGSFTGIVNNSSSLRFGSSNYSSELYFDGKIDDVRVYNYALTSTQVKQLYNNNSAIYFGP